MALEAAILLVAANSVLIYAQSLLAASGIGFVGAAPVSQSVGAACATERDRFCLQLRSRGSHLDRWRARRSHRVLQHYDLSQSGARQDGAGQVLVVAEGKDQGLALAYGHCRHGARGIMRNSAGDPDRAIYTGSWATLCLMVGSVYLCVAIRRQYDWVDERRRELDRQFALPAEELRGQQPLKNRHERSCNSSATINQSLGAGDPHAPLDTAPVSRSFHQHSFDQRGRDQCKNRERERNTG